ncbi:hypothetical protein SCHPADRAFT_906495 [Schizopora paradoxa]|uniref:Uncharacterized protein n=1 Tax=Schizopora paradoxa TaxID=27342 RepID=A0A0H2RN07_9AGAM|nr:hypothetical protein SCHPADRAFT_906495 [Schizopora paradoxa]
MPALRSFSFVNDGVDTSHILPLMQRNHDMYTHAIPSAARATSFESTKYQGGRMGALKTVVVGSRIALVLCETPEALYPISLPRNGRRSGKVR